MAFSGSISRLEILPTEGNATFNPATGSVYIQDAQLNQGLVATPYLETTTAPVFGGLTDNMPRLDYTDATCPSLLLEPSRSNIAAYSEYIGIWTGTGFDKNFGFTSPEGVNNAYEIRIDSLGGAPSNIGPQLQTSISASTQYTVSAFVKPLDALSEIRIATFNDDAQRGGDFDFTNNTFTALNTGQETGEVIPFGDDGWYRVSLTYTSGTDISVAYRVSFPNGTVRDGNTAFLLYGLQVEQGSYPTSYIPTYGSTQTRLNDSFIDLVYNLGTSFSIYVEADNLDSNSSNAFCMRFGNISPQLYLAVNKSTKKMIWYTSDGTGYMGGSGNKIALSYDGTTWTWAADGVSSSKAAGANDVVLDKVKIATNGTAGGGLPKLSLKKFILFDEVLTASELEALTL